MDKTSTNKTGAAVAGFFGGGVAGWMAAEAFGAFCHFVLDLSAEDTGRLVPIFIAAPLIAAVAGALICLRVASRK